MTCHGIYSTLIVRRSESAVLSGLIIGVQMTVLIAGSPIEASKAKRKGKKAKHQLLEIMIHPFQQIEKPNIQIKKLEIPISIKSKHLNIQERF